MVKYAYQINTQDVTAPEPGRLLYRDFELIRCNNESALLRRKCYIKDDRLVLDGSAYKITNKIIINEAKIKQARSVGLAISEHAALEAFQDIGNGDYFLGNAVGNYVFSISHESWFEILEGFVRE